MKNKKTTTIIFGLFIFTSQQHDTRLDNNAHTKLDIQILILKTKITLFVLAQNMLIFEKKYSQLLTMQNLITGMIISLFSG